MLGLLPAEIGGLPGFTSLEASMTYTPADSEPDDTVLLRKARYVNPLDWELEEGEE
jgi:hypothetical protein